MTSRHESLFDVAELETVKRQHVLFVTLLFVFVPGNTFGGQHEPVISGAALHNTQVVDAHVALPDDLVAEGAARSGFRGVLRLILGAISSFIYLYESLNKGKTC